jgi:hypothetical protein
MKSEDLLDRLSHTASSQFVLNRDERWYSEFLQLYANVGYAPTDDARDEWKRQTISTWHKMDRAVPDTCTGGFVDSKVVSSWGTIPFSPKVAYGHSVCMEKSLMAAATLFKQSLESLTWVDRLGGFEFWAGSYKTQSAFTSGFQVLPPELDCYQRRVFMIRFFPDPGAKSLDNFPLKTVELSGFVENQCTAAFIYLDSLICAPHESMSGFHSVKHFGIYDQCSTDAIGHLVFHDSVPNLTAANVPRFAWLFLAKWPDVNRVVPFLRQIAAFSNICIQAVCEETNCKQFDFPREDAVPAFWVFTPRKLVPHLRDSFQKAFCTVLKKYSGDELAQAATRWECSSVDAA